MGCIPSKNIKLSSYEKERIESILSKSLDSITDKDVEYLTLCLQQFEKESDMNKPLLLINNINDRLEEIRGYSVTPAVSEYDLAVANIKSHMRKLKDKIKQLEGEKELYKEKALEAKTTDLNTAKRHAITAKNKNSKIEQNYLLIERLEQYLTSLNEAKVTQEMVDVMKVVATSLDSMHEKIGSVEEVEELIGRLDEYNSQMDEIQGIMEKSDDESLHQLEQELDENMAREAMQELNGISVPTAPVSIKKEKKDEMKRVAELEE